MQFAFVAVDKVIGSFKRSNTTGRVARQGDTVEQLEVKG
jgi:hypothetical protein